MLAYMKVLRRNKPANRDIINGIFQGRELDLLLVTATKLEARVGFEFVKVSRRISYVRNEIARDEWRGFMCDK